MDTHLLAENPMSDNGQSAIVRTIDPVSIYEVHEEHILVKDKYHKHFTYVNPEGIKEKYTLSAHFFFSKDFDNINDSEVYKRIDEAWFWYMAYMKWEDEQIDEENL